jgi:hypothetical protein
MRWPTLLTLAAASLALGGCDRIPFIGRQAADTSAADTATATSPAPTTAAAPESAAVDSQPTRPQTRRVGPSERQTPAAGQPPEPRTATRALADEPWTPTFTGTVDPGMTREEVVAAWGPPVADRGSGAWTYLFFRNGCEVTCGTFDVVLLENGQVVDAIVRAPGHAYSGVSSSPPERPAEFTAPTAGT